MRGSGQTIELASYDGRLIAAGRARGIPIARSLLERQARKRLKALYGQGPSLRPVRRRRP